MYSNSTYDPLTEDTTTNVGMFDTEDVLSDITKEPNIGQFGYSPTDFNEVSTLLDYINKALEAALIAENGAEEVSLIKDQIVAIQVSINGIYEIFSSNWELFENEYANFLVKYQDFLDKYALISQMIDAVNLKYEEIVELGDYIKQLGDDIKILHDQVVDLSSQTAANAVIASNAAISAEASKVSANTSEVNSKNSEIASKLSETEAKTSEVNSKLSEVNAKNSETNSKLSEINSSQSEVSANASATSAAASEVSASSSAASALQSKESAQASETASRISEVNSKQSELESKQSELAAKSSEDNSKASETASKLSEVNSKQSEVNSALSAASSQASAIEAANSDASAISAAASALDSKNSAKASEISAAESAVIAANAASVASGALIEAGNVDLSGGVYPTPLKDSSNNPVSCYWKVTVGGVVSGTDYGSGDSLVYSKTISGYYKIDNTESVTSVAGKQGIVTLNKSDVGLNNVDNTSDINKPVSTATQSLLDLKVDKITTINSKSLSGNIVLTSDDVGAAPSSHVGSGGTAHATATTLADGFMSKADKSKLESISSNANNYVHPTSGITPGTYKSVTVDINGHITNGSNPSTVDGYGIVDAVKKTGDTMSGPLSLKTIQGQGSSITWASIDVTGAKGEYAGFNFTDAGHWFGVRPNGLSGVWDSAGTPKWYFNENGQLDGGATVRWGSVTNHPNNNTWANQPSVGVVVGQLAWKNYGNGHTIFDASAGTSPDGTVINNVNTQHVWSASYPTLMGWNGTYTYGVRVDSARLADGANWAAQSDRATYLNGTVSTSGQDLKIHGKRAIVGVGDSNQLTINYANDWGSTLIQGQTYLQTVDSNRHVVIHNGSTNYTNSGLEVRSSDGSDARIGFHRAGHSAASINHNAWGFQFERESGAGSRANVAAANFFADAAQDMTNNALTRLDYVGANFLKYRNHLSPDDGTTLDTVNREYGFNYSTGGGIFGPYISFGGLGGNYECQINAQYNGNGSEIKFRTHNGDSGAWNPWNTIWNSANFDPNTKLNAAGGTVSGTVYNSVTGAPNTFVGGKISSESGTLSLDAYTYAFVTSPQDAHLCYNSYYQPSTGWKKYDDSRTSGKIVINGAGLHYVKSDAGSQDAGQHAYDIFHTGNLAPLAENGTYGGTLHLGNWFRSYGASGWFNETYGGGIYQDEVSTVKVYAGKKFYVVNEEYNAIGATGGIFSYRGMAVDTRTLVGNGSSYNYFRYNDAPFHAGFGGLNTGSFAPIVGSANYTNGHGYTTRVQFGVVTPGATGWSNAVIMVGSAENDAHPLAAYTFDAYGNFHAPGKINCEGDITTAAGLIGYSAYVNGPQQDSANALTRKDYVDTKAALSGAEFTGIVSASSFNAQYTVTGNTGVYDGSDRVFSERYHPKFAYDRGGTATVLWSGSSSSHPTTITLSKIMGTFSKIRFEGVNAGASIAWATTLSVDEMAAICNTGLLVYIASGTYSYTFNSFTTSSITLSRNTSVNGYLTKIVGIR